VEGPAGGFDVSIKHHVYFSPAGKAEVPEEVNKEDGKTDPAPALPAVLQTQAGGMQDNE
jgi:hypothetical protein